MTSKRHAFRRTLLCLALAVALCGFGRIAYADEAEIPAAGGAPHIFLSWETPCFECVRQWNPQTYQYETLADSWQSSLTTLRVTSDGPAFGAARLTLTFVPSSGSNLDAYFTPSDGVGECWIGEDQITFLIPSAGEYAVLLRLVNRGDLPLDQNMLQIGRISVATEMLPAAEAEQPAAVPIDETPPPEAVSTEEAALPEATPADETPLPEAIPAEETVSPEATPADEAALPVPSPADEAASPEPAPADEAASPEPTPAAVEESAEAPVIAHALPDSRMGQYYQANLTTGSPTPVTWSIIDGSLPLGLTLRGDTIYGAPHGNAATYELTLQADNGTDVARYACTLRVRSHAFTAGIGVTANALPEAVTGEAYDFLLTAAQTGTRWRLTDGALPAGMWLLDDGSIEGTPEAAGAYSFRVTESNGVSPELTSWQTIVIAENAASVTSSASGLPGGVIGRPYQAALTPAGTADVIWRLGDSTQLPEGLSLAGAHLTGTPLTAGQYSVTVIAQAAFPADAAAICAETTFLLTVAEPAATPTPEPTPTTEPDPAPVSEPTQPQGPTPEPAPSSAPTGSSTPETP